MLTAIYFFIKTVTMKCFKWKGPSKRNFRLEESETLYYGIVRSFVIK